MITNMKMVSLFSVRVVLKDHEVEEETGRKSERVGKRVTRENVKGNVNHHAQERKKSPCILKLHC